MSLKDKIAPSNIPEHIAVIMDGNGRWAQRRGNNRIFGHKNGVVAVRDTIEAAGEIGVKYLTLYAFSTENWKRPKTEVDSLMSLLVTTINKESRNLLDNNVRLKVIGKTDSLPKIVASKLNDIIEKTSHCTGLTLILALSYSSKWEIIDAIKKLAIDVKEDRVDTAEITDKVFEQYLNTKDFPDPELLIRTSGEYRLSNFLLWQIAYCELYFTDKLWPDFRKEDFYEAIVDFQHRERRFGKTGNQVDQMKNTVSL